MGRHNLPLPGWDRVKYSQNSCKADAWLPYHWLCPWIIIKKLFGCLIFLHTCNRLPWFDALNSSLKLKLGWNEQKHVSSTMNILVISWKHCRGRLFLTSVSGTVDKSKPVTKNNCLYSPVMSNTVCTLFLVKNSLNQTLLKIVIKKVWKIHQT